MAQVAGPWCRAVVEIDLVIDSNSMTKDRPHTDMVDAERDPDAVSPHGKTRRRDFQHLSDADLVWALRRAREQEKCLSLEYYARRKESGFDGWSRWPRRLRWRMNVLVVTILAVVALSWFGLLPMIMIATMGVLLLLVFIIGQRSVGKHLWPWG